MRPFLLGIAVVLVCGLPLRAADAPEATKPADTTAAALLRVSQDKDDRTDYRIFRNTQAVLIKSRLVLNGALRKPGIADLAVIKGQKDPAAWLEEHLQVSFPLDGEVLRVAVGGAKPRDAARLVNAVVETYLDEFVGQDRTGQSARLDTLKDLAAKYTDKLRERRAALKELATVLGGGDEKVLTFKQELALKRASALQNELLQVQSELRRLQLDLDAQGAKEKAPPAALRPDALDEKVEKDPGVQQLRARVAKAEVDLEELKERRADVAPVEKKQKELHERQDALTERRQVARAAIAKQMQEQDRADAKRRTADLRERLDRQKQLEKLLAVEVEQLEKETRQVKPLDLGLEREEVNQIQTVLRKITAEVEILQVQKAIPPRITLIEKAEVPRQD